MARPALLLGLPGLLAALGGCPKDPLPPPLPPADTGVPVDRPDATPADTQAPPDTQVPVDTTPTDTGTTPDTTAEDVVPDGPPRPLWCDLPTTTASEVRGATVPEGFCLRRYGRVRHPRTLVFSPDGDLFVASPQMVGAGGTGPGIGAIAVLPDDNHDGVAEDTVRYADLTRREELETVHGLLFAEGFLYYTVADRVLRVPWVRGERRMPMTATPSVVAMLPDAERWTHGLARHRDGTIFVSMGVYGATFCPLRNVRQGAILAVGGSTGPMGQVYSQGYRNPMYLRCYGWGECYAAELTDDGWFGPGHEKIVNFHRGEDYGYPCCYDRGRISPTPRMGSVGCDTVTEGIQNYEVGFTPFGFDYEPGRWPGAYQGAIFVGLHGRVGSWEGTGIRWAPVDPTTHRPSRAPEVFLGGWGAGTMNNGRVADLVFAPDGRLFFSDDQDGSVYWVAPRTLRMP